MRNNLNNGIFDHGGLNDNTSVQHKNPGIIKLFLFLFPMLATLLHAQANPALEMGPPPSAVGVAAVTSYTTTLFKNTDNPSGNTFAAYNTPSPLQVTYAVTQLQYTDGIKFGDNSTTISNGKAYDVMTTTGNSQSTTALTNTGFTSFGASAGTGIDVSANYGIQVFTYSNGMDGTVPNNARTKIGEITITFSRAVSNPLLHFKALGAAVIAGASPPLSSEFNVKSVLNAASAEIGGSTSMSLLSGNLLIDNTARTINNSHTTNVNNTTNSGRGTVQFQGLNIQTIVLEVYIKGNGSASSTSWLSPDLYMLAATVGESDLQISKTVDNSTPVAGNNVTFTVTAKNNGASNDTGVTVNDLLPSGYTYVSGTVSSGTTYNSSTGVWNIGTLNDGASSVLTVTATVKSTGSYTNIAAISTTSGISDPVASNNSASVTPSVVVPPDSDNDGITDNIDRDDDNDGILDNLEMRCLKINAIQPNPTGAVNTFSGTGIPSFTATFTISTVQSAAYVYTTNIFGYTNITAVSQQTNTGNPVNTITFNRPVYSLDAALDDVDKNETATLRFYDEANNLIPGSVVQTYVVFIGNEIGNVTYPVGQSIYVVGGAVNSSTIQSAVRFTFPSDIGISRIEYSQLTQGGGVNNNGFMMMNGCVDLDTDGDGIWNRLDLDSDNDGCLDAMEGDENVAYNILVSAASGLSVGTGSSASNQNLCAGPSCVNANGVPNPVNAGGPADIGSDEGQGVGDSQNASVSACYCYKPAVTSGTVLDTPSGITALGRSGNTTSGANWPMVRKGAWMALESKTKGFVINRLTTAQISNIPASELIEGMMVYNTSLDCLQVNTTGTPAGWACLNAQTCPSN